MASCRAGQVTPFLIKNATKASAVRERLRKLIWRADFLVSGDGNGYTPALF
jgi:hypothetical protein